MPNTRGFVLAPAVDKTIDNLAEEIRYETAQLIDNRAFASNSADQIAQEIKIFIGYYSSRYNDVSIAIVYGDETLAYFVNNTDVINTPPNAGIASVTFSGSEYDIDMEDKGLYVLITRERLKEKNVIVK